MPTGTSDTATGEPVIIDFGPDQTAEVLFIGLYGEQGVHVLLSVDGQIVHYVKDHLTRFVPAANQYFRPNNSGWEQSDTDALYVFNRPGEGASYIESHWTGERTPIMSVSGADFRYKAIGSEDYPGTSVLTLAPVISKIDGVAFRRLFKPMGQTLALLALIRNRVVSESESEQMFGAVMTLSRVLRAISKEPDKIAATTRFVPRYHITVARVHVDVLARQRSIQIMTLPELDDYTADVMRTHAVLLELVAATYG